MHKHTHATHTEFKNLCLCTRYAGMEKWHSNMPRCPAAQEQNGRPVGSCFDMLPKG